MLFRTNILFTFLSIMLLTQLGYAEANFCSKAQQIRCGANLVNTNAVGGNALQYADYGQCASGLSSTDAPYSGNDVVYKVDVNNSALSINMSGLSADLDLFVFKGCSSSGVCVARSVRPNAFSEQITINNADGTYYIVVDGKDAAASSNFLMTVRCQQGNGGGGGGGDDQDDCSNYTCNPGDQYYISCGEKRTNTTAGSANNFDATCSYTKCYNGSESLKGKDVVYVLDVPAGKEEVEVTLTNARDLGLFVFRSNCNPSNCIGGNANFSLSTKGVRLNNPSGRYLFVVDGRNSNVTRSFSIEVDCKDPVSQEFKCSDARNIDCGDVVQGTTRNKPSKLNYDNYYDCVSDLSEHQYPYEGGDQVYRFYLDEDSKVTIQLRELYDNLDLFLFRSCSDSYDRFLGCIGRSIRSGNYNETITIDDLEKGVYYIVVDGKYNSDNSSFKLSVNCEDICEPEVDDECDLIHYDFIGSEREIRYKFSVPSYLPNGVWTVTDGFQQATGTGRIINVRFNSGGKFKVCYKYSDYSTGCLVECCIDITITNPFDCDEIEVRESTSDRFLLSLNDSRYDVTEWFDVENDDNLGTNRSSIRISKPAQGTCRLIGAKYFDYATRTFGICYVEVCGEDCDSFEDDCENLNFEYAGAGLTYNFNVINTPTGGSWTVQTGENGSVQSIGSATSTTFEFPEVGTYTVCYNYTDADGCLIDCCRTFCVDDPFACDELAIDTVGGTIIVTHPTIPSEDVIGWTATTQLSANADQLAISIPSAGECNYVTLSYFDEAAGCYKVCGKQICNDDFSNLDWLVTLITELNGCCDGGDKAVQRGVLGNETVFIVPDCAATDGFTTLYSLDGEVICQVGGIAGLECDEFDAVTNLETVWTCLTGDCAAISERAITCASDGEGIVYSFTIDNFSGLSRPDLLVNLVPDQEIGFGDCSTRTTVSFEGRQARINIQLNNCGSLPLEEVANVLVELLFVDELTGASCVIDATKIAFKECGTEGCIGEATDDSFCTTEFAPVCGCNNVTYSNACNAEAAGINLWVEGECETPNTVADLEIGIQAANSRYSMFSTISYTVTLTNNGPATATNILIDAALPEGTAITAPIDPNYLVAAQQFRLESLAAGETKEFTFNVFALTMGMPISAFLQIVEVDQFDPDSTPGNNEDSIPAEDDEAEEIVLPNNGANLGDSNTQTDQLSNYPNPFQQETVIQFYLPEATSAQLEIFDVNGKRVFAQSNDFAAGTHNIPFRRTADLATGLYFYRLQTSNFTLTETMVIE